MNENTVRVDKYFVSKLFPKRTQDSNKGTYGTVLNVAGSIYYTGAAYLSSISALRAGAGLVRLASETNAMHTVASNSCDITFVDLGTSEYGTISKESLKFLKNIKDPDAISIGCGLSTLNPVRDFVIKFFEKYVNSTIPFIIDADGINIISLTKNIKLPLNSCMTPHPLELSRLINVDVRTIQEDRVKWANYASSKYDCIVLLKGKDTVVSIPNGGTFINPTGNSGLSHAGTGDVLCGLIAGFAAQGVKLEDACVLGAYIHGRAGDLASEKLGEHSVLASDVLNFIPNAMKEFRFV